MTRTLWILALVASTCIGCANTGPGSDCDTCAVAEANPMPGGGSSAAASARGGMEATNAPFSGETGFTPDTTTAVGRGAGDTALTKSSADKRNTASGGAQNTALYVPTAAEATALGEGGGTALAIRAEFSKDMQAMRDDMASVRRDPELSPEQRSQEAAAIRASMESARTGLALALSHVGSRTTTIDQGGDNTLVAYSRAGTGVGQDDPKALEVLHGATEAVLKKPAKPELPPKAPSVPLDGE